MLGTTLSHYEILEKLGEGGMGVVYRAQDTKLGRDVAIKVLRSDVAPDGERRKRFEQEARAASALNHPNIITIYEIGEHAGTRYLAMEHVEGRTLRSLLQNGPLPASELLDLARQIVEGLAKAHAAGIVHRDLKPENIMVSDDGYVKILDFGLAKLWPETERATADSELQTVSRFQTGVGTLLGTPAYMSPEQAKGLPVDFRSDLFSLGAILYEMATGERPFARPSAAETFAAILEANPSQAPLERASVSGRLKSIVLRCLSRSPEERYDDTRALAEDLRGESTLAERSPSRKMQWLGLGALVGVLLLLFALSPWLRDRDGRSTEIRSIAVLPLENLSADPEQEYFADGMTEALITELSRIGALRVISRTSAMRYKNTDKSLPEIASELGVDAVVEGSVLRAGDRVRVTTQLIDAAADRNLWAESYDRELQDVLALHTDVARAVTREIEVALTPVEISRLNEAETESLLPEAYEAYLRGRYHLNKYAPDEVEKATFYFQRAIELQPRYAAAYAGLADSYSWLGTVFLGEPPAAMRPRAIAAARNALAIDPDLAEAHTALGWAEFSEYNVHAAEQAFARALTLNPSSSEAHRLYAYLVASQEQFDEAIEQARMAVELDPISVFAQTTLGHVFLLTGRYEEAVRELDRALELDPRFLFALQLRGVAYLHEERFEDAISTFESMRSAPALAGLGCARVAVGEVTEARELLKALLTRSEEEYVPQAPIAWLYSCLGEDDEAIAWLERAFESRTVPLHIALRAWWQEDHPFRSDPRVRDLLARMDRE